MLKNRLLKVKYSLINIYAFFAIMIVMMALMMSGWVAYSDYQTYKKTEYANVEHEAIKLIYQFNQRINTVERMISFLAKKIVDSYDYKVENIEFLIREESRLKTKNVPWSVISYMNNNQHMVVDSINGVKGDNSYYLSKDKRSWIVDAVNNPGVLHFSKADISHVTSKYIIPSGYGIVDGEHYFVGYLSTGILINELVESLKNHISGEIVFILIDDHMRIVSSSDEKLLEKKSSIPHSLISNFFSNASTAPKELTKPLEINNIVFTHSITSSKYPFTLVVGNKDLFSYRGLKENLAPHVIRHIILAIIFGSILFLLGYKLFKPLIQMSEIVKKVAQGKKVEVPHYEIHELNLLGEQLENIQLTNKDIRKKNREINKINEELEKMNAFVKSNVSFLSHELRNPTNNIIGFSDLLKKHSHQKLNKDGKEYLDIIHQSAMHQDKQIDFFLKIFKYREQGKELENKEVDLKQVIEFSCNMLRYYAIQHDIKLKIDVADDLPKLIGDEIIVGHLVQNFISNGIKYNKKGGELLIKSFLKVNANGKKELILQFKDNGIGIKADDVEVMFKKFNRIQNEKTDGIVGYGLGLTYAKSCIIAHDGEIKIKSEEGKGTVFTISFPSYRLSKIK